MCYRLLFIDMIKTFKKRSKRSVIWEISLDSLNNVVRNATTLTEILNKFGLFNKGGNSATLKRRLDEEKIDYSHIKLGTNSNLGRKFSNNWMTKEECLSEIFIRNSLRLRKIARVYLKKYNLIPYECKCGLKNEWNGNVLSLQLEHKNGIDNDHRLINLEWMCPNCHSQTKTFAGRSKRIKHA